MVNLHLWCNWQELLNMFSIATSEVYTISRQRYITENLATLQNHWISSKGVWNEVEKSSL